MFSRFVSREVAKRIYKPASGQPTRNFGTTKIDDDVIMNIGLVSGTAAGSLGGALSSNYREHTFESAVMGGVIGGISGGLLALTYPTCMYAIGTLTATSFIATKLVNARYE